MSDIITMIPHEDPELSYKEIKNMFSEYGTWRGLRILERTFFEISGKLNELEFSIGQKKYEEAKATARTLKFISPQVGFHDLADVADHIIKEIDMENYRALPVICDRMVRVGDACLHKAADITRVLNIQ